MALKEIQTRRNYISIKEGTLRKEVTEDTPGAVRRDWVVQAGTPKEKRGTKWEHVFGEISGKITSVEFFDGDFGESLILGITDGEDPTLFLAVDKKNPHGEDLMKKLPNIDINKEVILKPYGSFTSDEGKEIRGGVTVLQDGNKVQNFFFDPIKKENTHGFPAWPEKYVTNPKTKEKVKTELSKDEMKLYFATANVFLSNYIKENHLITVQKTAEEVKNEQVYEDITNQPSKLDEIPF